MDDPADLSILGDGTQSKSYIYVSDVIGAMRLLEKGPAGSFTCHNVATLDCLTVTEIADIVVEIMGLKKVRYHYSGGDRGWKGDVPVIRLNSDKLRALGWSHQYTTRQAIYSSVGSIVEDAKQNKFNWRKS
jgi:UDP-glucose 4-epimerase